MMASDADGSFRMDVQPARRTAAGDEQGDGDRFSLERRSLEELNRTLEQRIQEEVEKNLEKDRLLIMQGRLATMGQMIGSLAHQWRQPLNFLGLILQDIKLAHEHGVLTPEYLDAGVREGMEVIQRMSRTISDFRTFFQPDREKQRSSVNAMVASAVSLVEAGFRNNAITLQVLTAGEVFVEAYPHEYSLVILILLNNAKDALVERTIKDASVTLRLGTEGPRSVVTIADNAGGIPEGTADRIFDPFSTAAEDGNGSGIALFLAKSLIEQRLSGRLTAKTVEGGTEFEIAV